MAVLRVSKSIVLSRRKIDSGYPYSENTGVRPVSTIQLGSGIVEVGCEPEPPEREGLSVGDHVYRLIYHDALPDGPAG